MEAMVNSLIPALAPVLCARRTVRVAVGAASRQQEHHKHGKDSHGPHATHERMQMATPQKDIAAYVS